jgi:hypothetical protein
MNSRVHKILLLASLLALSVPGGRPAHAQAGKKVRRTATEWLSYGGDKASSKYSPLAQIGRDNFNRLRVAWTWRSAEVALARNATAAPMTHMLNGKQFIVVATGGSNLPAELIALRLP